MSNIRRYYRVTPEPGEDIQIGLLGKGNHLHAANILDASGDGMRVVIPEDHPEDPALGRVFPLRVSSSSLIAPIDTPVMIAHAELEEQTLLLGLRFLDAIGLAASLPKSLAPLFNLRQDPRLVCDPATPIEVMVRGFGGAFELRAVLYDLSRSGLCFSAPLLSQCALGRLDYCKVEFKLPGCDRQFRFGAALRYRSLSGEALRYGVFFEEKYTEGFRSLRVALEQYVDSRLAAILREMLAK